MRFCISQKDGSFIHYFTPCDSDLAEINDEAVSAIEAGPRHIHLCGTNGTSPFNMKQTLHIHVISHHMLESRGHTTLLCRGKRTKYTKMSCGSRVTIKLKKIVLWWYTKINCRWDYTKKVKCKMHFIWGGKLHICERELRNIHHSNRLWYVLLDEFLFIHY